MHIAFDVRIGAGSGVGTILRNVVPLIAAAGHRVTLIGRAAEYGAIATAAGASLVEYDAGPYSLGQHVTYPRWLQRRGGVDVLHVPHYVTPIGWRGPLVCTINDLTHLAPSMPTSAPQRAYVRWFVRHALKRADVALTLSETSRREIIGHFGARAEGVRTVHCGVDLELYQPVPKSTARAHADRLVGTGVPYLLFLSSVRPHKNLDGLLLAFAHMKKTTSIPHRLLVVGEREGFIVRSNALAIDPEVMRDVVFAGYTKIEDLPNLYSACAAFVFPSFSEGFGLPPLEAMACGAPVVSSNASSLPEILGDAAEYVAPGEPSDIARGIMRVISFPEYDTELSRRGLERSRLFPWSATASAYIRAYADAMRAHGCVA